MNKNRNMLEMIPKRNQNITWGLKNDKVVLTKHRNKLHDRIIHKLLKTPLQTHIELEEIGSFIWQQCDNQKSLYDISCELENHFGDKVHPTINRLLAYIKTLSDNDFIHLR